ncbi:hypothetical protein CDIK_1605 [Cucumispora dikerogammari]|nr:hypothetical protein CDIK_1605 [Cucumispora dikerogammari]
MFNDIIQSISAVHCTQSDHPSITVKPTLIIGGPEMSRSLDGVTIIPEGNMSIETVVDLERLSVTHRFNLVNSDIIQTPEDYFFILDHRGEKLTFFPDINYSIESIKKHKSIMKDHNDLSQQNKIVFSLRQGENVHEHPLFVYLSEDNKRVFKLSFILPGTLQESTKDVLTKEIRELETELQPLKEFQENDVFYKIDSVAEDNKEKLDDKKVLKEMMLHVQNLSKVIKKINGLEHISDDDKLKICTYLIIIKMSSTKNSRFSASQSFDSTTIEAFKAPIRKFIKQQIKNRIYKLKISCPLKHIVLGLFDKGIDEAFEVNDTFLSLIIENLEKKILLASKFIIVETGFYNLNKQTKSLENIIGEEETVLNQ